jgi:hypothetical protein
MLDPCALFLMSDLRHMGLAVIPDPNMVVKPKTLGSGIGARPRCKSDIVVKRIPKIYFIFLLISNFNEEIIY